MIKFFDFVIFSVAILMWTTLFGFACSDKINFSATDDGLSAFAASFIAVIIGLISLWRLQEQTDLLKYHSNK